MFFNDPATTEIYTYCHTLSLHDALPIRARAAADGGGRAAEVRVGQPARGPRRDAVVPQPSEGRIARHPRSAVLARAVDRTRRLRRGPAQGLEAPGSDRKSTRLNSSH